MPKDFLKNNRTGKAGEYLVCADLILKGYEAYLVDPSLPYDILLDTGDRMLKVQVKTCSKPGKANKNCESLYYQFATTRSRSRGRKGVKYTIEDYDLLALVGMDQKLIGYTNFHKSGGSCLRITPANLKKHTKLEDILNPNATIEIPTEEINPIVKINPKPVQYKPAPKKEKSFWQPFKQLYNAFKI